jgi:hypothetical protein
MKMFHDHGSNRIFAAAISLGLLLGPRCSTSGPSQVSGGSGSDAPNSLTVISAAGYVSGTSKPHTVVGVYRQNYVSYLDSGFHATTMADTNGLYDFGPLDSGSYNVLASDSVRKIAAFIAGITVAKDIGPDTLYDTLKSVGSIAGSVADTTAAVRSSLPIFIPGSPFCDTTDAQGRFSLRDLPAGDFTLRSKEVYAYNGARLKSDTLIVDTAINFTGNSSQEIGTMILKKH